MRCVTLVCLHRFWFLWTLMLLFSVYSWADEIIVGQTTFETRKIGSDAHYLVDANRSLTIDQVMAPSTKWQVTQGDVSIFGYTDAAIWQRYRFNIADNVAAYVRLNSSSLDQVDFWCSTKSGVIHQIAGDTYTSSQRTLPIAIPTFYLPNGISTCYLRVISTSTISLIPRMLDSQSLQNDMSHWLTIYGAVQGAFVLIILISVSAAVISRSPHLLLYTGTALFYMIWSNSNSAGLSDYTQFLPRSYRDLMPMVTGSIAFFFMSLFIWRSISCWSRWFSFASAVLMLANALALVVFPEYWLWVANQNGKVGYCEIVLNLSATLVAWRRYKEPVSALFFGQIIFLIPGVGFMLLVTGKLPANQWTLNAITLGSMSELIFFAAWVGQRYRQILKKNEELLQAEVARLDADAKDIIHMLKHDAQHPLRIIVNSVSAHINAGAGTALDAIVLGRAKQAQRIVEAILAAERDQLQHAVDLSEIDIIKPLHDIVHENLPILQRLNQRVIFESLPVECACLVDRTYFIHVIDNILSNFHKHTSENSTLYITLYRSEDVTCVQFDDDGDGVPVFRENKKTSGLWSIKRRMEMMRGNVHFGKSEKGGACIKLIFQNKEM